MPGYESKSELESTLCQLEWICFWWHINLKCFRFRNSDMRTVREEMRSIPEVKSKLIQLWERQLSAEHALQKRKCSPAAVDSLSPFPPQGLTVDKGELHRNPSSSLLILLSPRFHPLSVMWVGVDKKREKSVCQSLLKKIRNTTGPKVWTCHPFHQQALQKSQGSVPSVGACPEQSIWTEITLKDRDNHTSQPGDASSEGGRETLLKFLLQGPVWSHFSSAQGDLQPLVNTNTPEWLLWAGYPSSQLAHVANISFCSHCSDLVQQPFPPLMTLQERNSCPGYILYLIYPLLPLAPKSFSNQPERGQMGGGKKVFFTKPVAMERDSNWKNPTHQITLLSSACLKRVLQMPVKMMGRLMFWQKQEHH